MSIALAWISVVLIAVRIILFAALHAVPSPYDPIRHAVSDYAVGPTRRLSSAMTWVTAAGWVTLAGAVWFGLTAWTDRGTVSALLLVLGGVFAALPFVPTDVEGQAATTTGRLHYALAIAWFAIAYSLSGNFARLLSDEPGGAIGAIAGILHWVLLVSLVVLVAALLVPGLRPRLFGLSERVFIGAVSVFYLVAAIGVAITV